MSELSTRSDDEVIESIAIIDEARIDPVDDLHSFDLLLFRDFLTLFQTHSTVYNIFLSLQIDRIIDDDIDRDDRRTDILDCIFDLSIEFSSDVIPVESRYNPECDRIIRDTYERKLLEIRQKILFSYLDREVGNNCFEMGKFEILGHD